MDKYPEEAKQKVAEITSNALAEGRWTTPEDYFIDPTNIEFIAYWLQKTRAPLVKGKKGYEIEQKLSPFRKPEFDLKPAGFLPGKQYRLSAVGDLMFAQHLEESKDRLFQYVEDLVFGADCAYANLESTLTSEVPKDFVPEKQGESPYINITEEQYQSLVKHRQKQFDIVQLANNHILDCAEEGFSTTINQLKQDGISFTGVYETEAASKEVTMTRVDDVTIGWVSHTYSVNDRPVPEDKPWICNITPFHNEQNPDTSRIEQQIKRAREVCDLVILTLHWGLEHEFYPHPKQIDWAHQFAELGADAIFSHHPHVIQAVEIYKPENDKGRSVPVIYSLGNITPAYGGAATVLSLIASLGFSKGTINGKEKTVFTDLKLTPVAFMEEQEDDRVFAAVIPLAQLNRMQLDPQTREYVNEINRYADLVLG
ncbi:MAG: CapA family protein, partial [bacterium]